MYELIASNKRRSILMVIAFVALVAAVGWVFGEVFGVGYLGLPVAAAFAIGMSWFSYFNSDKIVLAMSHARPADHLNNARLMNVVEGLAIAAGLPTPRVFVVDDPAPNAFATGRDPKHAAVAVTTGLLEKMNRVELEGVLAHEMIHIQNHDILVTTIAVVLAGVVTLLSDWMLRGFWRIGGRRRAGGLGAVIGLVGLVVALLAPLVAQILRMAVSRKRELLADSSGVLLTRYPPGLISALKKLREDSTVVRTSSRATAHLWIESPLDRSQRGFGGWLNRLFDTHPPLDERIKQLEHI
ncbi:MAG: M48 family metalloprotease [Actinomycetota bacterium]|nr:M48 family metalloprotease [Actinomycetota bacterium]